MSNAFGKALDGIGVSHSAKTNGCDIAVHVIGDSWEYGDAGFSGIGDRDAVSEFPRVRVQGWDGAASCLGPHEVLARLLLIPRSHCGSVCPCSQGC